MLKTTATARLTRDRQVGIPRRGREAAPGETVPYEQYRTDRPDGQRRMKRANAAR